jgi:hypothetical protein
MPVLPRHGGLRYLSDVNSGCRALASGGWQLMPLTITGVDITQAAEGTQVLIQASQP